MEQQGKKLGSVAAAMAAGVTALALTVGAAQPAQALLEGANPDLVIIDGDKRFFDFSCFSTSDDCGIVRVVPLAGDDVGIFVDFVDAVGNPIDFTAGAGSTATRDFTLEYYVEVLATAPHNRIIELSLAFTAADPVEGSIANVTEQAFGFNGEIAQIQVQRSNVAGNIVNDVADPLYEPNDFPLPTVGKIRELFVSKDVQVVNGGSIRNITQDFKQAVPAPAALASLGFGLLALGFMARRRRG